jgi:hypothetical protein
MEKTGKDGNQTHNVPALGSRLRGNDGKWTEPAKKGIRGFFLATTIAKEALIQDA